MSEQPYLFELAVRLVVVLIRSIPPLLDFPGSPPQILAAALIQFSNIPPTEVFERNGHKKFIKTISSAGHCFHGRHFLFRWVKWVGHFTGRPRLRVGIEHAQSVWRNSESVRWSESDVVWKTRDETELEVCHKLIHGSLQWEMSW